MEALEKREIKTREEKAERREGEETGPGEGTGRKGENFRIWFFYV